MICSSFFLNAEVRLIFKFLFFRAFRIKDKASAIISEILKFLDIRREKSGLMNTNYFDLTFRWNESSFLTFKEKKKRNMKMIKSHTFSSIFKIPPSFFWPPLCFCIITSVVTVVLLFLSFSIDSLLHGHHWLTSKHINCEA